MKARCAQCACRNSRARRFRHAPAVLATKTHLSQNPDHNSSELIGFNRQCAYQGPRASSAERVETGRHPWWTRPRDGARTDRLRGRRASGFSPMPRSCLTGRSPPRRADSLQSLEKNLRRSRRRETRVRFAHERSPTRSVAKKRDGKIRRDLNRLPKNTQPITKLMRPPRPPIACARRAVPRDPRCRNGRRRFTLFNTCLTVLAPK